MVLSLLSLYRIPSLIPYFIETQRTSFLNFLQIGLPFQLKTRFVSEDQNIFIYQSDNSKSRSEIDWYKIKIHFYPEYYLLSRPKYTPKLALVKFKNYNSKLYIPILYKKGLKLPQYQWVILNELPLMTSNGHFILKGVSRVVVNQIIRSPGIYYTSETDKRRRSKYSGQLISRRGTWLELELDKQKRLWVKIMKKPKIPGAILLQALGFNCVRGCADLIPYIRYWQEIDVAHWEIIKRARHSKNFIDYELPPTIDESIRWIYYFLSTRETKDNWQPSMKFYSYEILKCQRFLVRKFFSYRTYDLGNFGRTQLNKKFGLCISNTFRVLTPKDILAAINYLFAFEYGKTGQDDIDHLKNRRVRTSGELVEDQFRTGFSQAISKFFTQTNEEWLENQKGWGWPKKKSDQPINVKPPGKLGRPPKNKDKPVEDKPKGKLGRPPKNKDKPIEDKPKGKLGRPPKNKDKPIEDKPPGKLGRPPKNKDKPIEDKPKGKLGRPPKNKDKPVEDKPKGKLGRPPKNKDKPVEDKPKGKLGRPPKNKDKPVEDKPKGKLGRPPKNKDKPIEDKPPAKLGRPPKNKDKSVEDKPPGKLGRPPKNKDKPVEDKPKGKLGRPPKNKDKPVEDKPPGKLGRPPKNKDKPVEDKPPAKRGRPPKNKDKPEQEKSELEKRKPGEPPKNDLKPEQEKSELEKRKPGEPPKNDLKPEQEKSELEKRKPGEPPKNDPKPEQEKSELEKRKPGLFSKKKKKRSQKTNLN